MELGPHAAFIWAAYAAAALVLVALAAWLIHDGRRQQRRLDDLEARGLRRDRSDGPPREGRAHAE
jgi:heme exporter protein D